jgi:hypothetical protein
MGSYGRWAPLVGLGLTFGLLALGLLSFLSSSGGPRGLVLLLVRVLVLGFVLALGGLAFVDGRPVAPPSGGLVLEHRDVRIVSVLVAPLCLYIGGHAFIGACMALYELDLVGVISMLVFATAFALPGLLSLFVRRRVVFDPSARTYTISWRGPLVPIYQRRAPFSEGTAMLLEELPGRRGTTVYRISVGAEGASPRVIYDSPNGVEVRDVARRIESITGWVAP